VTRSHSELTLRTVAAVVAVAALLFTAGCGDAVLKGRGSSYLIVSVLQAASGAKPQTFTTILESDVVTNIKTDTGSGTVLVPTVYEDMAQVSLKLAMKDPTSAVGPSDTNAITINRYHVDFVRSDGRNTQGVDVPYSFDGAMTGTVNGSVSTTLTFALVRAQAKLEAPLMALRGGGGGVVVSTIAQITFYGQDQAGNAVTVSATISVNFADWGDPA
jgi:hypothetical protein